MPDRTLELRRNPDGSDYRGEDGERVLEWVEVQGPDLNGELRRNDRWRDRTCFLCGKSESWFRVMMYRDMSFCPECLPDNTRIGGSGRYIPGGEWQTVLTMLVRQLAKESHGRRQ